MPRDIVASFRKEIEAVHTDEVVICFLTISHPLLTEPIRVNWDTKDFVFGGDTFIGFPFEISILSDDETPPKAQLTIQNIDSRIGETIRGLKTPPRLKIELLSSSDFDLTVDPRVESAGGATATTVTATGSGSFVVDSGVTSIIAEAWGGGGSGGGTLSAVASGGGGGGYSKATLTVTPGQTVFYSVGTGGASTTGNGNNGNQSWINPAANSPPASNGVIGGGGTGGSSGVTPAGSGSIGTINFSGGTGGNGLATCGGGGGGGAGSASNGTNGANSTGTSPSLGGAGGTPDGGAGSNGQDNGPIPSSTQPGGGGGGCWFNVGGGAGAAGANGQIRYQQSGGGATVLYSADKLFLTNTKVTFLSVSGDISGWDYLQRVWPGKRATQDLLPGLFR